MESQSPPCKVPGLLSLPTELLDHIFKLFCFCFDCQSNPSTDLSAFFRDPNREYLAELRKLSLTCRRLRDIAQPILFHRAQDGLNSQHFVGALRRDPKLASSVKCLSLMSFSRGQGDHSPTAPVSFRFSIDQGAAFVHTQLQGLSSLGLNHVPADGIRCLSLVGQLKVLCINLGNNLEFLLPAALHTIEACRKKEFLPCLTSLLIRQPPALNHAALAYNMARVDVALIMLHAPKLKHLELDRAYIDIDRRLLSSMQGSFRNLTTLRLTNAPGSLFQAPGSYTLPLKIMLGKCTRLVSFSLSFPIQVNASTIDYVLRCSDLFNWLRPSQKTLRSILVMADFAATANVVTVPDGLLSGFLTLTELRLDQTRHFYLQNFTPPHHGFDYLPLEELRATAPSSLKTLHLVWRQGWLQFAAFHSFTQELAKSQFPCLQRFTVEVSPLTLLRLNLSVEGLTAISISWARAIVVMFEGSGVDVTIRTTVDTPGGQSQILAQTHRRSDTAAL